MKLRNVLITTNDIQRAKQFYHDLFGLDMLLEMVALLSKNWSQAEYCIDVKVDLAEMALRIGRSEKTVQRIIASLIEKNLVEREGSNKVGFWRIK